MSWTDNPVRDPQKYGFDELLGTIELSGEAWSFNLLAVLRNEKGYYLGTDSGCSCPSPFENHTDIDFTGPLTAYQAREEIESLVRLAKESTYFHPEDPSDLLAQIV